MSLTEIAEHNMVFKNFSIFSGHNCKSLIIDPATCIGIVGMNKPVKTKFSQKLTGQQTIKNGDIFLNGISLRHFWGNPYFNVAYCSEQSALLKYSTGRENLEIFGLIKGIPRFLIHKEIRKITNELDLNDFLDKFVYEYSESTRKKFGLAVALIGDAKIIILDEPTLGLDSVSKQKLLSKLDKLKIQGKSIILLLNDLRDYDEICSKLVIMRGEEIHYMGTPQNLKNRFSHGITISIQLRQQEGVVRVNQTSQIKEVIERSFPLNTLT